MEEEGCLPPAHPLAGSQQRMQGQCWVQPSSSSWGWGHHTEPGHFGWVQAGRGEGWGEQEQELCRAEDLLLATGPASGLINSA